MMTNETQPGVEVPEPDWSEQLIDAREPGGMVDEAVESVPGSSVLREAEDGDVAEQGVIVEIDDDDGYDDSASI
ncbi:hypothetical protein [Brevibacterium aurantiacum]|uniref:Uncharacterized protein n=1 Tax=Brevibacterium aurantiacum TaxID=273384 RepID=A0A556C9F8_BREAU|nr:hypothetical protein [Brevibacterium aurantiacum]TSI14087.1 hypothetical protein FO013_15150 [Brevibacterium aurantiacum]